MYIGGCKMRVRLTLLALIVSAIHSTCALAAEPQLLIPDTTKFTFSSETKGSNKFCNLLLNAVKVPGGVTLNAVAARLGPDDRTMVFAYEIKVFEAKIKRGLVSDPQFLQIKDASISSKLFSSEGVVKRAQPESALYAVEGSETAISNFTATITEGTYFINVQLLDGRSLTYAISGDVSLLSAADKWLKCTMEIAK